MCNVSLMLPIFALKTVVIESLGSLHIFAMLAVSFQLAIQGKVWCLLFVKFQIAAVARCFTFSNQDGLFVISYSLAATFQATKMRMPHLLLAGVVFCFAGRGVACIALLSLEYFQV